MIGRMLSWLLVAVGTVPTVGFVASLHVRSRGAWRRDAMGRHLMGTMAALAAVFLINTTAIVVSLVIGAPATLTWFVWPYLAAFGWVDLMLWRRWWLLHHPPADSPQPPAGTTRDAHSA